MSGCWRLLGAAGASFPEASGLQHWVTQNSIPHVVSLRQLVLREGRM